ncbi:MAG: type-F conjugative transfer system protein TraW [Kocuria rhizophila]|nr:type-F conjugative transfer system protein TraW [uncultured Sphingomonas sp.]PZP33165.1 MAG: type-F conjugative transfer system protein TraW [Kocuria rhizophila]
MKPLAELVASVAILSLGMSSPIRARDHGTVGQTFPIVEADLLTTIDTRLRTLEANGGIERMNKVFAERSEARIRRPKPVAGVTAASEARQWIYDPTIAIEKDIHDPKGNLVARAGQTVNPLDFVTMRQSLVFVDGDDPAQMDWATRRYSDANAKIIMVNGSPIDAMTTRQRRFYFDQEGRLTGKLGVRHTPAIAQQDGRVVKLSEIVLRRGG